MRASSANEKSPGFSFWSFFLQNICRALFTFAASTYDRIINLQQNVKLHTTLTSVMKVN